jgi:replication factor A1
MNSQAEETVVKVAELEPRMSNITISFKVIEKGDIREVTSRRDGSVNRVSSAVVGDETGIVTMPLWNDRIQEIESGKTYELKNSYTGFFRGNLRLKIGRDSEFAEAEEVIQEINSEVDMSEEYHGRPERRHYYEGYSYGRTSGRNYGGYGGGSNRRYSRSRRDNRRRRRRY